MTNIKKQFPGVKALDGVDFFVKEGEIHGLVGENGAGKSTLMKILSGIYSMDEGEIKLHGEKVSFKDALHAQISGVSLVYQEPQIVRTISIAENIFLGDLPRKKNRLVDFDALYKTSQILANRVGLQKDVHLKADILSMGECQLVQIARALRRNSSVVVMDEPTSSLTEGEKEKLFVIARDLKSQGVSIVYISHRIAELFEICDRVTVLKDGKLVKSVDIGEVDKKQLVNLMVGRELGLRFPEKSGIFGDEVLRVEHLTRAGLFEDISFSVRAGEVLGFGGLIGAGRTEVMDAIFGMVPPDSGEVYINGKKAKIRSTKDAIDNKIAYATEDRHAGLILHASILENVTLPSLRDLVNKVLINEYKRYDFTNFFMSKLSIKANSFMDKVNGLSGGNQQKVVFAKWLMKTADIYILDEPTRGIDVGAKEEIYKLIHDLANSGKAVIVISSELPELIGISDRILVMHSGRITGEVTGEEATEKNIIEYATGVMSA